MYCSKNLVVRSQKEFWCLEICRKTKSLMKYYYHLYWWVYQVLFTASWILPWLNFLPRFNDLRKGYTKPENRRYKCDFHSCFHRDNSQLSDTMHHFLYKAQFIFQCRSQRGPGGSLLFNFLKIEKRTGAGIKNLLQGAQPNFWSFLRHCLCSISEKS